MRRKRRNLSPAYKTKVALAAIKEDKMLAAYNLSAEHDVHVSQIQAWHCLEPEAARAHCMAYVNEGQ